LGASAFNRASRVLVSAVTRDRVGRPLTFQRSFVVKQLAKANQSDRAWTCRLRLPFFPPLSKYQLLQLVYTQVERIIVQNRDMSFVEVFGVELERVSGA
jgi:hypothetical protein